MKNIKKQFTAIFSLLVIIIMTLTSCDNGEINLHPEDDATNFTEHFGATANKNFMGKIVDENNNPIDGVSINIGSKTATTDANGVFIIKNADVYEQFAYVTAKKVGYLNGSRSLIPTDGVNKIDIMLLYQSAAVTVSSGVTSEVALPNGAKVKFDGNFKEASGAAYSGDVAVYMHHLSPSDNDVMKKMPGMLYAQNSNDEERLLETYGMLNVELIGANGQTLNIADGHKATIEMPVDSSQTNAPNTIDLWHFDETHGFWVQDGTATIQGDKYVGEVSHFSWWNCDAQFPTVTLCMNITDDSSVAMANIKVELSTSTLFPRIGYSDEDGAICGLIPSNTVLDLKAYDVCGNLLYTDTVGPFSSDDSIDLALSSVVQSAVVTGNLINCSNENVTNGYILFNYGGLQIYETVTDGVFSFSTIVCSGGDIFTIEGIDLNNLESTGLINQTFTSPITDFGNMMTCGNTITEYITYQIDNEPVVVLVGVNAFIDGGIYIDSGDEFIIQGQGVTAIGVYNSTDFNLWGVNLDIDDNTLQNIQFVVSNIGTTTGDYIDMTFSGTYTNSSAEVKNITGTVHVKRNN